MVDLLLNVVLFLQQSSVAVVQDELQDLSALALCATLTLKAHPPWKYACRAGVGGERTVLSSSSN